MANQPPLPPDRAFVVQFRTPAASGPGLFAGRIEHLTSGAAGSFASVDDLVGFVTRVLAPDAGGEEP